MVRGDGFEPPFPRRIGVSYPLGFLDDPRLEPRGGFEPPTPGLNVRCSSRPEGSLSYLGATLLHQRQRARYP